MFNSPDSTKSAKVELWSWEPFQKWLSTVKEKEVEEENKKQPPVESSDQVDVLSDAPVQLSPIEQSPSSQSQPRSITMNSDDQREQSVQQQRQVPRSLPTPQSSTESTSRKQSKRNFRLLSKSSMPKFLRWTRTDDSNKQTTVSSTGSDLSEEMYIKK